MGFMGLHIGINALKSQQRALDVIGHNIANANTKGYSRQRAELTTTLPYTLPGMYNKAQAGQVGTGVKVKEIVRSRDLFMDTRFRQENSLVGEWQNRFDSLNEIQLIFNEPSENGLRYALNQFWGSLQNLHNDPTNGAFRSTVRQSATSLADVFKSVRGQLKDYRNLIDSRLQSKVNDINSISHRIADLNDQISKIVGKGDNPNDLLDRRDLLLDELSAYASIDVRFDELQRANVSIYGFQLVTRDRASEMKAVEDSSLDGFTTIKWVDTDQPVNFDSGEIKAILDARDETVLDYIDHLDRMANTVITEYNRIHETGYGLDGVSTGYKLFSGKDASDISVHEDILDEVNGLNRIAAAAIPNADSNGEKALEMSQLKDALLMNSGTTSMNDYWAGVVSQLGVDAQRAEQMTDNQTILTEQLESYRQSVSGVSLDEEMANLIKYQHAYNAAAKFITTESELLDTLVNGILR